MPLPFPTDVQEIPTVGPEVGLNIGRLIGYAEAGQRQEPCEGDVGAFTAATLRYLVRTLNRFRRLENEDVDFLAWSARSIFELYLLTRYALMSPQNLLDVMLWRITEYKELSRSLFGKEPADPKDEDAMALVNSTAQMEAWAQREGLKIPRRLTHRDLAEATGLLDDYDLTYKPLSKLTHPTPLLLFGRDSFVHGDNSRRVQLALAQLFAARLLEETAGANQERAGAAQATRRGTQNISTMNPDKLAKWTRWIGDGDTHGTISRELIDLSIIRDVYSGVREMVGANPALQQHSAFHSVFRLNYAHSVLMYVRRQVQPDRDSANLIMLAYDLRDSAQMVTSDFYAGLYTRNSEGDEQERRDRMARADFARYFGGDVGTHLDPALAQRDVDDLTAVLDAGAEYTNRRIAHLDKREPTRIPASTEVEAWCDVLNTKLRRFVLLLQAADYRIEPVLNHDWRAIFQTRWIPEKQQG